MPQIKPQFVENEIYHIYNRGVEKRDIFLNENDYLRFIQGLYEFNDENSVTLQACQKFKERGLIPIFSNIEKMPLVEVLAFCLMPNHYHLLLRQLVENGIPLFMQKLGSGYAGYFNLVYKRVGSLFQGTYKARHINNDAYYKIILLYIHLNSLEFLDFNLKEGGIDNWPRARKFLEQYKWSSHLDYLGKENFPKLVNTNFLSEVFDSVEDYQKSLKEFNQGKIESISHLILE